MVTGVFLEDNMSNTSSFVFSSLEKSVAFQNVSHIACVMLYLNALCELKEKLCITNIH